jgi:hypothetical protein
VERFYLQFSDFGTPDTLARFGADVIPLVRATAGPTPTAGPAPTAGPEALEHDDKSF